MIGGFITLLIVVLALVVIYYSYQFLFGASTQTGVVVLPSKITANQGSKTFTTQAPMYEGGEYTVNMWLYLADYKERLGTRKHVLSIGGTNFATLLVALGAYKNSLLVRVDTRAASGVDASGHSMDASGSAAPAAPPAEQYTDQLVNSRQDTSLTTFDQLQFFKPLAMDDSLLNVQPACDIDEIDLQRWVQISVVLNGRTCDVYMDGKLARSCVLRNYFKVDPTGQSIKIADRGGFNGYVSQVSTYNYALGPDAIYRSYMTGPAGGSTDILAYVKGLFVKTT
jgi:hypothetical protein